jgi:hypothetical protein
MKKLLQRLLNLVKRVHAPQDDLDELLAERRRLEAIAQWRQTEMMESVFRLGYWTGRCGVKPRIADGHEKTRVLPRRSVRAGCLNGRRNLDEMFAL